MVLHLKHLCGNTCPYGLVVCPGKAPVAGIAMGLISDGNNYTVLTDGKVGRPHWNFKVAGTRDGITALQMDIKIQGIFEILTEALTQAKLV